MSYEQWKQENISLGINPPPEAEQQIPQAQPIPRPIQPQAQQVQLQSSDQLVKRLGGKLPMTEDEYQKLERTVDMLGGKQIPIGKSVSYVNNPKKVFAEEVYRRKVYQDLLNQKHDPEQIKSILDIQKKMQAFPVGRAIGAAIGSIGLPALINLIPGMAAAPEEAVTVPVGRKIGQFLGGVAGAGFGGAGGETAQIAFEEKRLASRKELVDAALVEMATEAGMRGLAAGGKAILSNVIKQTVPEAARTIEEFSKAGGVYTPAQMDKRLLVKAGEEVARGAFGAKEIFDDIAEKNVTSVKIYADRILDSLTQGAARKGPIELGQEFAEGITRPNGRMMKMVDDLFDPLYNQVDQMSKGAKIRTTPLKTLAKNELAIDSRMMKDGGKGLYLTPKGRMALNRILELKDEISFSDMRTLRSGLIADARSLGRDLDKSEALVKRIAQKANETIFDSKNWRGEFTTTPEGLVYGGLTPEARNLLQNTNRLYKSTMETFEQTFPEKLVKQLQARPADVTKQIFKPKNPAAVKQLRQALIEPISGRPSGEGKVMWNQLRTAWLADIVDTASKEGKLNYHTIDSALRNLGDDTLKEMFPGADIKKVENIKDTFRVLTRKPSGGASLFIRGSQVGGAVMLYNGVRNDDFVQVSTGGTLLLGPYFYAKIAVNPTGRRILTAGFKNGFTPGSRSYAPTVARLINLAAKLDRNEQKERLSETKTPQEPEHWRNIGAEVLH